jgi:hypothetical protein
MRKLLFTLFLIFLTAGLGYSQVTTLWEKSAAAETKPTWETGSTTRGISYGFVNGQHLLFVATRSADVDGKMVAYYNAVTGDSLGVLSLTGITGGTFVINDVEVSADGKIFLCNLTTNAVNDAFKVYRYDSLTAAPVVAISYNATADRLGDKFTVTGSASDNSLIVWAASSFASATAGPLHKFTTADNGITFTATSVPLAASASSASVAPLPNQDFYLNTHGTFPIRYSADGTAGAGVPGTVIATSGSAIRFIKNLAGDEFIISNELLTTSNNAKVIKVPGGNAAAGTLYGATPVLGATSAGGLGDVSVRKVSELVYHVYVLASNNGFGAYKVTLTPSLAGTYYIGAAGSGPGGTNPHFASLREAFDILNDAVFTGDCIFYITSDITETYPTASYGLGLAINPEPFTVTFKPYTGVQPVISLPYPGDLTSGPSGALVIGLPSKGNIAWDSMRTTKNIVIDGSNTPDGSTRDLTITNLTTSHRNGFPMTIVGDVSNMVIKNTNIYYKAQEVSTSGNLFVGAVMVRSRNYAGRDWTASNLLFENNHLSANFDGVPQSAQGYGTYQTGTPNVKDYPYNITLKNNLIEGKRRAVALYRAGNHEIFGNEIVLNQNIAANIASEAIYAVDVDTNSVVNIYNNMIKKISSKTNTATFGNTGISIESFGTYNIYNNMIFGFELTAENPTSFVRGIKNSSASATLNLYYNTIYMDNLADIGTATVAYQGIYLTNGINNVKNNIVVSAETDFASYCIYRDGTAGTLVSNYNDFYPVSSTNGNVGFWNTAATPTLAEWRTASGQDLNSISKQITFVSTTDLHLAGSSVGDFDLIATPIEWITKDIDGENRHPLVPYKGADEGSIVLPVEFTAFSASVADGIVQLTWSTATELNNKGFEVERKGNGEFMVIGFVVGKGTSAEPVQYSFSDKNADPGKYSYRLKQVDFNGSFAYSEVVEVELSVPLTFGLSQNYPNPFNPTTTINFQIAEPVNVTLTIYNALGAEVAVLINNQFTTPGQHTAQFNASKLASGTYVYRLTAGSFVETRKMILMK